MLAAPTPQEFEFFQAVRLIERLFPDRAPVGRFVSPDKEVMRFCAHASFRFPPARFSASIGRRAGAGAPWWSISWDSPARRACCLCITPR